MKMKKLLASAFIAVCFTTAPIFAETYDDTIPSQYYTQGQNYYQNSQYSSAIKAFRTALRENPNDISSKIGLINSYISRAEYYNNTTNSPQKALNDLKSAVFYFVCFNGKSSNISQNPAYISAITNLNTIEKNLNSDITGSGFIKTAGTLRMQGEFAAAGYDFYRALGDPVNSKTANVGLADVLNILGQPQQALGYYEKALQLSPDDTELRLKIARAYEKTGNSAVAAEHYNFALQNSEEKEEILNSLEKICRQRSEANPADAEAHCNLGVIYQKRGNIEGALSEYQKAEKLNPALTITKVNMAILYYDQKKYKDSIEASNKALLIDPKNVQARIQKAKCFKELSLWENATEEYKNALKYDPQNAEAQYGLAEIYTKNNPDVDAIAEIKAQGINLSSDFYSKMAYDAHKNKDITTAVKYYKYAIDANPNDKALYLNLIQIYNGQNDSQQALAYAGKAKQQFPNDEQINKLYNDLKANLANNVFDEADKLREQGSYKEAIAKYESIQPQNYNSYIGIAGIYQLMKDYPNAITFYNKALSQKPDDTDALLALTGIYIYQNDIKNADETIKKVSNKQNPKAKEMIAYINEQKSTAELNKAIEKYDNKDYEGAKTILTDLISQKLGGYMPYYYRAMVNDALGKYKEAVADYESVIAKDPSIPLVYYSLGVDYDSLKNFPRAVQNYKKFLELTKENNDYTNYARQRIKQSQ